MAVDAGGDLSPDPGLDTTVSARVGIRIRERRRELGRTLGTVAGDAQLSVGYLSSIETGVKVPSLPVLARLAHALEMSLADTLRASASDRLSRGSLGQSEGASSLSAAGSALRIVALNGRPGESGREPLALDGGDVFVYLHHGRMTLEVDGAPFELGPGDALHGDRPHAMRWTISGDRPATSVWAAAASPASG